MSGLYITGTDTEIGKTLVSTLLIQLLVQQGFKVAGMKPVASGASMLEGELKNEDALSLIQASNIELDYKTVNPYVFEEAASPHIVAEKAGVEIEFNEIIKNYNELQNQSDHVIVEGVGGWYAPLSNHTTVADLAEKLQLPVILVVGIRLGCLNHALLTAQAIRQANLPIAGWIANIVEQDFSSAEENISALQHFLNDFPFLGSVCYQTDLNLSSIKHTINIQNLTKTLSIKK